MKHIKRLFCLLLALVLALALCACGDSGKRDRDDDDEDDHSLADLIGPLGKDDVAKKSEIATVTTAAPVTTAPREPALKRGNEVGDVCYDAALTEISENGVALSTFDPTAFGKVTVINFWAYWCPPCVNELPHFDDVAQKYADQVAVVAVHCDQLTKAQEFIGNSYSDSAIRFAMDGSGNPYGYYTTLGGSGTIPYTLVLNEKGIITHVFRQAVTQTQLETAVLEAMGRM